MSATAPRTTFVTALGWSVLLFSALGTLIGVLQSMALSTVVPVPAGEAGEVPAGTGLLVDNVPTLVNALIAFWIVIFAASIGFLHRKEWARKLMMAAFVIAALLTAAIGWAQNQMIGTMFVAAADTPPALDAAATFLSTAVNASAVAFVGIFLLLAVRLNHPRIRAEFQ